MTSARRIVFLGALAGIVAGQATPGLALDYRSVAEPAVLYDAPSLNANRLFVIARFTPVEVIVAVNAWLKVRDPDGGLAWIEKREVSDRRTVIVRVDRAQIRLRPADDAPLIFEAERNVVLDLVGAATAGWVKVRHGDGSTGYVSVRQVWGA